MNEKALQGELSQVLRAYGNGDYRNAGEHVDRLLRSYPKNAAVKRVKGMVLLAAGDPVQALFFLESALQTEPSHPDGLALSIHARLILRRFAEAEELAQKFVVIHKADSRAFLLLAQAQSELDQTVEALKSIDKALSYRPRDAEATLVKARILIRARMPGPAMEAYRQSLTIQPSAPAATELAQILLRDSHPEDALAVLEKAMPFLPPQQRPYALVAQAYTEMLQFEKAEEYWRLAEKFATNRAQVMQAHADSETAVGRFEMAEVILRQALADKLEVPDTFFLLTRARKMTQDDISVITQAEELVASNQVPAPQRAKLNYALGKTYDDLRDYERAIAYYDEANRIDYALYPYRRSFNAEESAAFTDSLIRHFTPERIQSLQDNALDTSLPLFIMGMVRSGTTLTENIVGAHSQIKAGGEQMFWTQRAAEFMRRGPGGVEIDDSLVRQLSQAYLSVIQPDLAQIRFVTDKNPTNIHLAALLHGIYPKSKMIHLKRQPVDNLLSMWMTPFEAGVRCASNRANLVAFYKDYLRLLAHFDQVLPKENFKTVRYEELTSEPESTIRSIFAFIGLEPEEANFEPEKNKRAVLTPSVYQVRQPINRNSQARWKNYQPWLGEFAELLEQ